MLNFGINLDDPLRSECFLSSTTIDAEVVVVEALVDGLGLLDAVEEGEASVTWGMAFE